MTEQTTDISKAAQAAWDRMHAHRLQPTPAIYQVLFAFYENKDADLSRDVEMAFASSPVDTDNLAALLTNIQSRYFRPIDEKQTDDVLDTTAQLGSEIRQILDLLHTSRDDAEKYDLALTSVTNLPANASLEQIKLVVAQLAQETREIAIQNNALREQLGSSSNKINFLRHKLDAVREEALIDPLTQIGNRKAFTLDLDRITHEAARDGEPVSLLMVDIDFFKKFNDKFGHLVGDQVLKLVAKTLRENVKGRDSVARWGGEEFAILLPQTRMEDAIKVGDYLRRLVASKKIMRKPQNEELGTITLSMGATMYLPDETMEQFVERADQALYRAKASGRNCVLGNAPAAIPFNLAKSGEVHEQTASITVSD